MSARARARPAAGVRVWSRGGRAAAAAAAVATLTAEAVDRAEREFPLARDFRSVRAGEGAARFIRVPDCDTA